MQANIQFKHICKEDTYMFNYTQLPDELFTVDLFATMSLHAKVLYSFMLRRISISKENGWIDEAGDVYIYYKVDEIMEKFTCSNKTAAKIMAELEKIGLIEKKRQGQGRPDIIYVNKFSAVEEQNQEEEPELPIDHMELLSKNDISIINPEGKNIADSEVKNLHFKKCKNYTSKSEETTLQEVNKLHPNYIENNNKELFISSSLSPPNIQREQNRLLEEEEESYKAFIGYQRAENIYSAQITKIVFDELMRRDIEFRRKFTPEMFDKICNSVVLSRKPILSLPGFVNWCMNNVSCLPIQNRNPNDFSSFPQRNYNFKELESELLGTR